MKNRHAAYVQNTGEQQPRCITPCRHAHHAPGRDGAFYVDVFEFAEQNASAGDPNHYLSDGKVTLMIMPWRIKNYLGQSILPTGMDHIGFTVEDMQAFKDDVDELIDRNPVMNPPRSARAKRAARLELLEEAVPDRRVLPVRPRLYPDLGAPGALGTRIRSLI